MGKDKKLSGGQVVMYVVFAICLVVMFGFGIACVIFNHLIEGVIILLSSILVAVCITEAMRLDKNKGEVKSKEKKKKNLEKNLGVAFFKAPGVKCRQDDMEVTVNLQAYDSCFTIQNVESDEKVVFSWYQIKGYEKVSDDVVEIEHEENGVFDLTFPTNIKATVFMQHCQKRV